jgi:hypothetical protein
VSLIYSMLGEVRWFSAMPAVADRREGDPVNRWSPYFLSILRIIADFGYGVHGTQKLIGEVVASTYVFDRTSRS